MRADRKAKEIFKRKVISNDYLIWKNLSPCKRKITFFITRENPPLYGDKKEMHEQAKKANPFFLAIGGYKFVYSALRIDMFINGNEFPKKIDVSWWVLSQGKTLEDSKEVQIGYSKNKTVLDFTFDLNQDEKKMNCLIMELPTILGKNAAGITESVQAYIGPSLHDVIDVRKISFPGRPPRDVKGEECIKILFHVAGKMKHFHAFRLVHRDLRAVNILVRLNLDSSLTPFINDFDTCCNIKYTNPRNSWTYDPVSKKGYILPYIDIYWLYINLVLIYFNNFELSLSSNKLKSYTDFEGFFKENTKNILKKLEEENKWQSDDLKKRSNLLESVAKHFLEVSLQATRLAAEFKDEGLQHPIFSLEKYSTEMERLQKKFPKLSIDAFQQTCRDIYRQKTDEVLFP